MSFVTVVNDYPVLRPGLLVHSFSLNRGPLTPERLDRALREGITGGYYDSPDDEDALFMSIHCFDREYNASIGGEYGITRPGRTSGIALIFKEELNSKIRHQELIPDEAIDAYLSGLFKKMVAEERINPKEREAKERGETKRALQRREKGSSKGRKASREKG